MHEPPLNEAALLERIALGEHTRLQFKRHFHSPDALAAELAAFANSGGGTPLLIGVNDDGSIAGLSAADIRQLNQILSNASSKHVRPPIHPRLGPLPDSLSIDDIRHGKTNRRNPTLSEHAFRILPYRGMGSGIPRALGEWPQIELISEVSGNQFTARVQRPQAEWEGATEQAEAPVEASVEAAMTLTETDKKILRALAAQPLGRHALLTTLGYSQPTGNYKAAMAKLLRADLIEPTIPDKPNSRSQQYRLSAKGEGDLK